MDEPVRNCVDLEMVGCICAKIELRHTDHFTWKLFFR